MNVVTEGVATRGDGGYPTEIPGLPPPPLLPQGPTIRACCASAVVTHTHSLTHTYMHVFIYIGIVIVLCQGDEGDGYDEILVPGDYKENGHVLDDWIFSEFVMKVAPGVHVVAVIDCCHSGTAMDLPYVCHVGDTEIRPKEDFKIPASGMDLKPKKAEKKKKKEKSEKSEKKKKKSSKKASSEDADLEAEEEPVDKKSKKSKKKKSKSDDEASE